MSASCSTSSCCRSAAGRARSAGRPGASRAA
jgi:hypothetical protein